MHDMYDEPDWVAEARNKRTRDRRAKRKASKAKKAAQAAKAAVEPESELTQTSVRLLDLPT